MALVTIHRSPSPICDGRRVGNHDACDLNCDGDNTSRILLGNQSESYLAVKGAALILPQTECPRSWSCEASQRDIQLHLQLMLYLLRVQDKLKLAVKLESKNSPTTTTTTTTRTFPLESEQTPPSVPVATNSSSKQVVHTRYMVLVSTTVEWQDNQQTTTTTTSAAGDDTKSSSAAPSGPSSVEADVVLGIDIVDSRATVGLVLPIRGDCTLCLDGDGGFNISMNNNRLHNFKPVSVQAMWAALQSLIKARDAAMRNGHVPRSALESWLPFYADERQVVRSEASLACEWHATVDSTNRDEGLLSLGASSQRPVDVQLERTIRTKLKEIMMTVDLEEVTSKYLRERLEEQLERPLTTWRRFIDDEMIVVMRQMDAPSEIFPYLYLGSEWNASNLEELRNNKVGYILNVTREISNFYPDAFEYHNVRIFDEENSDLLRHWENTHKFIAKARDNKSKVLVHCKMGVSRSASTVIAFVMKELNVGLRQALVHVRSRRSCIQPNEGFRRQLEVYEGILDASRQRHSRLWRSSTASCSSTLDLRDAPSTPPRSVAKETPANDSSSSSSSSTRSPSPSNPGGPRGVSRPKNHDDHNICIEGGGGVAEPHKKNTNASKRRTPGTQGRSFSTSSDEASVFDPSSPLRPRAAGARCKSKSLLSVFDDGSNRPPRPSAAPSAPPFSRSRSASPKRSRTFGSNLPGGAGVSARRSWRRPESLVMAKLKPDDFWIKEEAEEEKEEEEEEEEEDGDREGKRRRRRGGETDGTEEPWRDLHVDHLTPGRVKRTKHEIETREKILSSSTFVSRVRPKSTVANTNNSDEDPSAAQLQVQRSSSFKMERTRSRESDQGGRKRRTHPLGANEADALGSSGRHSRSVSDVVTRSCIAAPRAPGDVPSRRLVEVATAGSNTSKPRDLSASQRKPTIVTLEILGGRDEERKRFPESGEAEGEEKAEKMIPRCKRSLNFREAEGKLKVTGIKRVESSASRADARIEDRNGPPSSEGAGLGRSKSVASINLRPVHDCGRNDGTSRGGMMNAKEHLRSSAVLVTIPVCDFSRVSEGHGELRGSERVRDPELGRSNPDVHRAVLRCPPFSGSTPSSSSSKRAGHRSVDDPHPSCSKPSTPPYQSEQSLLCN